jgi:hypothetical protein
MIYIKRVNGRERDVVIIKQNIYYRFVCRGKDNHTVLQTNKHM